MNWFEVGALVTSGLGVASIVTLIHRAVVTLRAQGRLQRRLAERYRKDKLELLRKEIKNSGNDPEAVAKVTRLILKTLEDLPSEEERKALLEGLFQTSLAGRANYADRILRRSVIEKEHAGAA